MIKKDTKSQVGNKLKKLINSHKFFVEASPFYMEGTPRLKYLLSYPKSYLAFMYLTIKDLLK